MIRGIHHVAVHVNDMDKMIRFYQEAFGFEQAWRSEWRDSELTDRLIGLPNSASQVCMMKAGNCYLEMFQYSAPAPESVQPKRAQDKGYTHFCVEVTGIEKEFERLKGLGMSFVYESPVDAGISKAIYGRDPEGNIIELQEGSAGCPSPVEALPGYRP